MFQMRSRMFFGFLVLLGILLLTLSYSNMKNGTYLYLSIFFAINSQILLLLKTTKNKISKINSNIVDLINNIVLLTNRRLIVYPYKVFIYHIYRITAITLTLMRSITI